MLDLVDSFSEKWLALIWELTVSHYWLVCFYIPMRMSFLINSAQKKACSLSYRYIDDLTSFNDTRFKEFISDIYSKEHTI